MNFGQELYEISRDISLEKKIWEEIKPHLKKIAADRHPKGCHIRFKGFVKNSICKIEDLIQNDGIFYTEAAYFKSGIGRIIICWDESGKKKVNYDTRLYSLSDKYLEVTLTSDEHIAITERELDDSIRVTDYTYIS